MFFCHWSLKTEKTCVIAWGEVNVIAVEQMNFMIKESMYMSIALDLIHWYWSVSVQPHERNVFEAKAAKILIALGS